MATTTITCTCPRLLEGEPCGSGFEVEVDFDPGHEGYTSGLPENCYPGEGPSINDLEMPSACPEGHAWTDEEKEALNAEAERLFYELEQKGQLEPPDFDPPEPDYDDEPRDIYDR